MPRVYTPALAGIAAGAWDITHAGVLFLSQQQAAPGSQPLRAPSRYDPENGRVRSLGRLDVPVAP